MPEHTQNPETNHSRWFTEEVHPHDGALKAYLRGSFPSVRDVDDLVQESYLRIWKFKLAGSIRASRALLFLIARHLAIDAIRRTKQAPRECETADRAEGVLAEHPDPCVSLGMQERLSLLAEALAALPTRCRQVIYLRKFRGLNQREVAERLGISVRTVESQYARGIKLCEAYLRKRGMEDFGCHGS